MTDKLILVPSGDGVALPHPSGDWTLLRGEGYSPVQSVVGAVGACGTYVFKSILENSKIDYTLHKVELSYTRDETAKSEPLVSIDTVFYMTIPEESRGRAERSTKLIAQYCPVIQSLNPNIILNESIKYI